MNMKDSKNTIEMKKSDMTTIMIQMIKELMVVNKVNAVIPEKTSKIEEMLRTLMTISVPASFSDTYYKLEKEYLKDKAQEKTFIDIKDIEDELLEKIYIHKGDITAIKADAIVNAANEKLLGCFVPGHHCIDNAIHMNAGLSLRKACDELMRKQGHDEEVGHAKITKGYNLPSKYVIHTVGPNINGRENLSQKQVSKQLKSCYTSILEEANKYSDIHNIVFCSISTGLFGVNIKLGSEIALRTIHEFLQTKQHHFQRIVIDVFSEEDYNEYKNSARGLR